MIVPDEELRNRLIEQARAVALERGWLWLEPVEVTAEADGLEAVWVVRTNTLSLGASVRVVFRRADITLVRAGYLPR